MSFEDYRKTKGKRRFTTNKPKKNEFTSKASTRSPEEIAARKAAIFIKREPAKQSPAPTISSPAQFGRKQMHKARREPREFHGGGRAAEEPKRWESREARPARTAPRLQEPRSRHERPARERFSRDEFKTKRPSNEEQFRKELMGANAIAAPIREHTARPNRAFSAVSPPAKKKRSGKPREWNRDAWKKPKRVALEPPKAPGSKERVQKLIAAAGLCSRRQAEDWIREGRVQVNGVTIHIGDQATTKDKITVNGAPLEFPQKLYIMLHKPKGYVTTLKDIYGNKTVMELIAIEERVYPVGRLDKDTTGLLLLTNDGEFANSIMHPRYEIQKTYKATLDKKFNSADAALAKKGIKLKEGIVHAMITPVSGYVVEVTLHQGYNHVVKRIMKELGYWVKELERTKIGSLSMNIPLGAYRTLSQDEITRLVLAHNHSENQPQHR